MHPQRSQFALFCTNLIAIPSAFVASGLGGTDEVSGRRAWTSPRVFRMAESIRNLLTVFRQGGTDDISVVSPATEKEIEQALLWAGHPVTATNVRTYVYTNKPSDNLFLLEATAPFPVTPVAVGYDWKGTVDKLLGYYNVVRQIGDDDIIVFCDAYDVFGNGFDGHELLRRYYSFKSPIVISTEESVFPREVGGDAEVAIAIMAKLRLLDMDAPARFLNAGGVIGIGWAMKRMYIDMHNKMQALQPSVVQGYADIQGHWFLHAYDQYELWAWFVRHAKEVYEQNVEPLALLDTEQIIFGSTVFRKENWPELLKDCTPANHSIDVDFPLVFDAPQSLFEIRGCHARFIGRTHFPIFWHGQGPLKTAWIGLRDRMSQLGCFPFQHHWI